MGFLLDTNVISETRKPAPDPNVRRWVASVAGTELYISVMVLGEIRQGIERLRRRDQRKADVYESWLVGLWRDYREHVLPITPEVAEEWGRLNAPRPIAVVDGLMAATARVHDLTLVTRNLGDVSGTGVRLLNPFEP
jgi:predicted nucleic acid-binding protein